jgi:uncharacterized protein (TIGR04255 family)
MPGDAFRLDLNETFPQLARAPIVEAVVHWQARAQTLLVTEDLRRELAEKLPEFVKCEPIQQFELQALVSGQSDAPPLVRQQRAWDGFRLTSEDGRYIVQFMRDGLVFSRTQPYEHWEPFTTAAKDVWQVYKQLAAPLEIQRLGVRFINHLTGATPENLGDFLCEPPTCPSNLPLKEFVYQSTFAVPEYPFGVRVIKLMQPPGVPQSSGLFLDCDVFTTRPLESDEEMEEALVKMRWLKNKFFFTLLKPEAISAFQ